MLPSTGRAKGTSSGTDFGGFAWLVLAAYVVCYDVAAMRSGKHSTLSAAFYKFSSSKMGRPSLILFWFYLTSHLFRWIPKKYDLFRRFFG